MLENKVKETIAKYNLIQKGDKIVVGVSGGPDSMTLLTVLLKLKNAYDLEIYVAHINHMLRENAIIDEEYVKEFCKKNDIELFIKHANIQEKAQKEKRGLEETGRLVRYNFFEEVLNKTNSNKIAIAHNLNDRVETIIMNTLRGSGLNGLRGIEASRGKYIRPLIEIPRDEIEKYCEENKINPRHDESNDDNTYTRNKIRNIVIPYIKEEFNPNILETMNRLAEVVSEENKFLNEFAQNIYEHILIEESKNQIVLDLKEFNKQDKVIKSRIMLYAITKLKGSSQGIEKVHIEDIIKLCSNNIGNKFLTPKKNLKILVKNKKIFITTKM